VAVTFMDGVYQGRGRGGKVSVPAGRGFDGFLLREFRMVRSGS